MFHARFADPPHRSLLKSDAVEWPTAALAVLIYGGWMGLTYAFAMLPLVVSVPAAAWLIAWHSSLQHEVVHGHPTRWRALNKAVGFVPLSLWLPFARYRAIHLCHHQDERLTDPLDDPESYYWTAEDWAALSCAERFIVRLQTRLLGRLTIGPAWSMIRYWRSEVRAIANGVPGVGRVWAHHLAGCAAIIGWTWGVCGITPWVYALAFVYPGTALLMLRSFAEHRAEDAVSRRTAIVEGSPVFGLLFLNNNLHAAHHARPTLPWYRLPQWYRRHREALIEANGGLVYSGYRDVARRYWISGHDRPTHPFGRAPRGERV